MSLRAPDSARRVFGDRSDRVAMAEVYAALLADAGVVRGLIGPREVPRLWGRHLLNCAVVADLIPPRRHVVDLGSGAGLPGLVLAIARPDLTVTLVEPLLRRTTFLTEAVDSLGLDNVEVVRARAEQLSGTVTGDVVTARALAPLERLARWGAPLLRDGGHLLALKGASAPEEVAKARTVMRRLGLVAIEVVVVGHGVVEPPTTVVRAKMQKRDTSVRAARGVAG